MDDATKNRARPTGQYKQIGTAWIGPGGQFFAKPVSKQLVDVSGRYILYLEDITVSFDGSNHSFTTKIFLSLDTPAFIEVLQV